MKKFLIIFSFLLITACEQDKPVFDQLSKDAVILAFGDSLTVGKGAPTGSDYPSILSKISFHKVINSGVSGEVSQAGLLRLPSVLDKHQPELLVLIHGGNDMLRKIPSEETLHNLKQMVDEARQRNIKVVMMGVPQPGLTLLKSAEIYHQLADEYDVLMDLETIPKILSNPQLKSDLVHPNQQGYQILAEHVFNLLANSGAL